MAANPGQNRRVVSGMRPTGQLHLGNYHGALANWIELQYRYECYFFVADWHALTTGYEDTTAFKANAHEVLIDWLGAGLNPSACTIFIQSRIPEHAELHLILSMVTPVSWLERVPTYKDQIEQLKDRDLSTYGFLGYPLLQSADILMYRPEFVPVGEDQVAHVEITREIARRFNHIYGREKDFEARVEKAVKRLGSRNAAQYTEFRRQYQEQGNADALAQARAMIESGARLTVADRERLLGYLEGGGRSILPEPAALLTKSPKVPGWTGARCRSPTATRSGCAKTRTACRRSCAPCRPIPRGYGAAIRATRTSARSGTCTRSIQKKKRRPGSRRVAARQVSVASSARSR
jgi:tryptophanyl-tRNA synthetase